MAKAAFWSRLCRTAVLGLAGAAALGLAGCSSSTGRFGSLGMRGSDSGYTQTAAADPDTTGSIPIPPAPVYANDGGYNRGGYANASYGRSNAYGGGSYSGGQYASSSYSGGQYGSTGYNGTARRDLPPPSGYTSGAGAYSPRPTPVSYGPSSANGYHAEANAYPAKQAVYTPPGWHASPIPGPRSSSTRVAMADKAELTGPGSRTITVQPGDSLYLYASRYHVSVAALKEANGMSDMKLTTGQKLIIPARGSTVHDDSYIVQPGDNLNAIAYKHGVEPKALAAANHITNVRSLQVGQELIIPGAHHAAPAPHQTVAEAKPQAPSPEPSQTVHVVKTTQVGTPNPASAAGQVADAADKPASKPEPSPTPASTKAPASQGDESQIASNTTLPQPGPMSGQRFRWPVQGRIVSNFGARADGGHNDGIDIAVPQGTDVRAAENGVVAYAGDELKGYGNLVLIRHANNWVTAYAHNENLLVKRGDKVTRGEIIAHAGATGSVSQPELHFELRKGSRPVDPLQYMTTSTASAD